MVRKKTRNRIFVGLFLVIGTLFLSMAVSVTGPFRVFELKWLDQLFQLRGSLNTQDSPIVLVAISEETDSEFPDKYPYPTSYYAKLIENLNKAGAKTIGMDIIFNKNDIANPESDSLFSAAIKKAGNVVLSGNINNETRISYSDASSAKSNTISLVEPIDLFQKENPNPWGFVSVVTDQDAFIRRYLPKRKHLSKEYYAFALEVLRNYKDIPSTEKLIETDNYFQLGDIKMLKSRSGLMIINFYGPPKTYAQYDMWQVVDDNEITTVSEIAFEEEVNGFDDPEFGLLYTDIFRDKIVLVGNIQVEAHDYYAAPFASSGNLPGYEIHANAIQTVLDQSFIFDVDFNVELAVLLVLALLMVFITQNVRAVFGVILLILVTALFIVLNIYLFTFKSIHFELTAPLLIIFLGYLSTTVYDFLVEQKEKRRIKNMFSSYVSPELVNRMIESGEEPQLGGDEFEISAFFSDIQSFSTFSEKLKPKELVDLINEYLSAMTDILTDEGGTLDKYIGDAIVAFFGAPIHFDNHAYKACRTAARMQKKQAELRDKWSSEPNWPEVVHYMMTRIGVNTGMMVTGNMGSSRRFNYTMMGDNVNLAARCESGAKSFGVFIMITEDSKIAAENHGSDMLFRYLDKIVVKGRSLPVKMFELVGFKEELSPDVFRCVELYEAGMQAYSEQKWEKAIDLVTQSSKLEVWRPGILPNVKDNPSLIMLKRFKEMSKREYIENWDGVFVMTSK